MAQAGWNLVLLSLVGFSVAQAQSSPKPSGCECIPLTITFNETILSKLIRLPVYNDGSKCECTLSISKQAPGLLNYELREGEPNSEDDQWTIQISDGTPAALLYGSSFSKSVSNPFGSQVFTGSQLSIKTSAKGTPDTSFRISLVPCNLTVCVIQFSSPSQTTVALYTPPVYIPNSETYYLGLIVFDGLPWNGTRIGSLAQTSPPSDASAMISTTSKTNLLSIVLSSTRQFVSPGKWYIATSQGLHSTYNEAVAVVIQQYGGLSVYYLQPSFASESSATTTTQGPQPSKWTQPSTATYRPSTVATSRPTRDCGLSQDYVIEASKGASVILGKYDFAFRKLQAQNGDANITVSPGSSLVDVSSTQFFNATAKTSAWIPWDFSVSELTTVVSGGSGNYAITFGCPDKRIVVDGGQRGFIANREYPDSIGKDFPGVIIRTVNAKDLHFDVEIVKLDESRATGFNVTFLRTFDTSSVLTINGYAPPFSHFEAEGYALLISGVDDCNDCDAFLLRYSVGNYTVKIKESGAVLGTFTSMILCLSCYIVFA